MVYHNWIKIDPQLCSSNPVIRGTRVLVISVSSQPSAGESFEKLRKGFTDLSDEDIRPAIKGAKNWGCPG